MNLLYCGNQGVFDGVLLSLLSAAETSSGPLCAYVLTMELTHLNPNFTALTEPQISYIQRLVQEINPENRVERIDATACFLEELAGCPNMESGYTPYTMLRLLADKLPLPDRLVYVDCDTLFYGDIYQMEGYDLDGYELAGVIDHLGRRFIAKDYLNAGVLYLNLAEMRKTKLLARCRALCMTKTMPFPDQDALHALTEKKLVLPPRFNQQDKLRTDTVIQHFCKTIRFFPYFRIVNVKPWEVELVQQVLHLHAYDQLFATYLSHREAITGTLAPPRKISRKLPVGKQLVRDLREVTAYAGQNGGIFRKKEGSNSQ